MPPLEKVEYFKDTENAKPFMKWAGGKTQLLLQLNAMLPAKIKANAIKTYIEPFVGGGAMFFNLQNMYDFENVILLDINPELVITYNVIKNNVEELIVGLKQISEKYKKLSKEEQAEFYYKIRDEYNSFDKSVDANKYDSSFIRRACLTIFLNRTCFNGLFRVNSKKLFNVPMGKYANPTICDEENLINVSKALKNATILQADFSVIEQYVNKDTFIYFDPPYRPISKTSAFNSYSDGEFNDDEQKRLKEIFDVCSSKGALEMLSNSDPTNYVADPFFDDLYSDYNIHRINATRIINSNASKRGEVRELLITNY